MNRSVRDVGGALLLVPQFTLAADTSGGFDRASRVPRRPTSAPGCSTRSWPPSPRRGAARLRPIRRRHAGHVDQRRPRHVLVAGLARPFDSNRLAYHCGEHKEDDGALTMGLGDQHLAVGDRARDRRADLRDQAPEVDRQRSRRRDQGLQEVDGRRRRQAERRTRRSASRATNRMPSFPSARRKTRAAVLSTRVPRCSTSVPESSFSSPLSGFWFSVPSDYRK